MITYRLADALPVDVVRENLEDHDSARRKRLERYLDAGHGSCVLRRPEIASLVIDNWLHFDRVRYRLCAWVVMPNHNSAVEYIISNPVVAGLVDVPENWRWSSARAAGGPPALPG